MANFLFVLGRDDNEKATRCFQFAKIAHEKDHDVNLFFIDSGVLGRTQPETWKSKRRQGIVPKITCPIWSKTMYR